MGGKNMFARYVYSMLLLPLILLNIGSLQAQGISFAAIADNRSYSTEYRVLLHELNEMTVNPEPVIPYPEFLVVCGDFDPVAVNMSIYNDTLTYPHLPPYYPVVGNHEFETPADMSYILNSMIPYLENVVNRGVQGTYSFDWGNVHCVVLDEYAANDAGEADADLRAWLQADLNATEMDHVFVFGHEPAFPRYRHVGDSLDQFRESRNAFWNMLVMDPRVRAYFCGHTHYYSRMRVFDPTSVGSSGFPNQEGGVYQIDCGAAGHSLSDGRMTLVYVHIEEDQVRFRAVTSPRTSATWEVTDEWTLLGVKRVGMQLIEPAVGGEVAGVSSVTWSVSGDVGQNQSTALYISNDAGAHWDTLTTVTTGEMTYSWETGLHADGTRYMLRIVVKGDSGFGMVQSEGTFTVNNPGNGVPEVTLNSPADGDTLSGEVQVEWHAADADGDPLSVTLDASLDEGATWLTVATDEPNDGMYLWDTEALPNSTHYMLRITCTDGTVWVEQVSGIFAIRNHREVISGLALNRLSGAGSGTIDAHIVDEASLTDHWYRITFDDTTAEHTTYDVFDEDDGLLVVDDAAQMDGLTEGPLFDGLRLLIRNYATAMVDLDHSGWTSGTSTLEYTISLPELHLGAEIIQGTPYPADYEIRIDDHVVDTSSSYYGAPQIPMHFMVWNVTEQHQVDIIYNDIDGNFSISRFDEVYLFEDDTFGEPMLTWFIFFSGRESSLPPGTGDVFTLRTFKPFTHEDVFRFTPRSYGIKGDVNGDGGFDVLDLVAVIRHILHVKLLAGEESWRADCNGDGSIDALDVVGLVNGIIGLGSCSP
jgi:hypothetical protein